MPWKGKDARLSPPLSASLHDSYFDIRLVYDSTAASPPLLPGSRGIHYRYNVLGQVSILVYINEKRLSLKGMSDAAIKPKVQTQVNEYQEARMVLIVLNL